MAHARFHLLHGLGIDVEVLGHGVHFALIHPAQTLTRLAQIEKQFALRLGGGDLDDAPVAQHVVVHLGLDPVHRERHQPHLARGVEALHGPSSGRGCLPGSGRPWAGHSRKSRGRRAQHSAVATTPAGARRRGRCAGDNGARACAFRGREHRQGVDRLDIGGQPAFRVEVERQCQGLSSHGFSLLKSLGSILALTP